MNEYQENLRILNNYKLLFTAMNLQAIKDYIRDYPQIDKFKKGIRYLNRLQGGVKVGVRRSDRRHRLRERIKDFETAQDWLKTTLPTRYLDLINSEMNTKRRRFYIGLLDKL